MKFTGALIREQGVEFGVVIVKPQVLQSPSKAQDLIGAFSRRFGRPVVLMAQDYRGRPTYYGRPDIARFLARVPLSSIPWTEYTAN